jgi:peptide/nickel transport system ATP-binding protein
MPEQPLLVVDNLSVHFPVRGGVFQRRAGVVRAVDGVSFTIGQRETLSLVGESGCGKSTTGLALMGLVKPTGGRIEFGGQEIRSFNRRALKNYRRRMQIVFQDPFSSLNPRHRVREAIRAPLDIHEVGTRAERDAEVTRLMARVGLRPDQADSYPHQFSGGQRQRIGIARALALKPKLVVADEPVSALDVSIQAQVVNLLDDLQQEMGLTYVIIAHDLSVIRHVSDRIAVMYLGKIVELTDRQSLYDSAMHPYTRALLSAVPVPDPRGKAKRGGERILLQGDVPSPIKPPSGCRFHTRCWKATRVCKAEEPPLVALRTGHEVACHHPENFEDQHPEDTELLTPTEKANEQEDLEKTAVAQRDREAVGKD